MNCFECAEVNDARLSAPEGAESRLVVGEIEGLRSCCCASLERLTEPHELVGVVLEEPVEVNTAGCD
jgi:hypothetical protein